MHTPLRSFVSLEYQNVRTNTKSIFALDNLWDGLGALTVLYPEVKYFFGEYAISRSPLVPFSRMMAALMPDGVRRLASRL